MSNAVYVLHGVGVANEEPKKWKRSQKATHYIWICVHAIRMRIYWMVHVGEAHREREEIQPLNRFLYMRKIDINVLLVPETILFGFRGKNFK